MVDDEYLFLQQPLEYKGVPVFLFQNKSKRQPPTVTFTHALPSSAKHLKQHHHRYSCNSLRSNYRRQNIPPN